MTELTYQPRGQHFEDFEIGQMFVTSGRTITEADIVNFAGLSGDYNQIHTDATFATDYMFGQRIAHGLLVQSIASGLAVQMGFIEGTILAFRESTIKFSLPAFIGDTIHTRIEVMSTKPLKRLGGGNVMMKYNVVNQDGKVVQRGHWTMLMKARSEG